MRKSNRSSRRGFTLLEVLIATAVTLLMMVSLAQVFKIIGDSMKQGRAGLQMNNALRSISFRLRHDLNNLTLRIDPPTDSHAGSGYFEYFDGAMTDYTSALFDPNNGSNSAKAATDVVRSSRFGDLDDILMFTTTSSDSWFLGQVPQFILNGVNPTSAADYTMVTISSRHAEIAVFARPIDVDGDGLYDDTDGDSMPDGYQLHYRTLLVRPDLNDPAGATVDGMLPYIYAPSSKWMVAMPQSGLPAYACDMALAHQQCDLSLRRVCDGNFTANGFDRVAANSLEDLMDPANRFAHVRMPVPGTTSTTMPVLALDVGLPILNTSSTSPLYSNNSVALGVGSGFLHSAFVLGRLASTTLDDARLGEDVLCSDVLAFDAKGFDAGVPILGTRGADNQPAVLNTTTFGTDGSDDVTLTPNDPGYGPALSMYGAGNSIVIGYGSYVDLMWGRKTLCSLPYYSLNATNLPAQIPAGGSPGNYLATELSGYRLPAASNWNSVAAPNLSVLQLSRALYNSGKVVHPASNSVADPPGLLQPTFDTWTTRYESDGIVQAERSGLSGVLQINGVKTLYNSGAADDSANVTDPNRKTADIGSDGLDNNGIGGIDDAAELETSPPFPVQLRGVKVSIRIEDRPTRQVRQMSVANEFVTQ